MALFDEDDLEGTIPARAGEPCILPNPTQQFRDYPRSRGGTCIPMSSHVLRLGLSPLARGNHAMSGFNCMGKGTIPARAGEPSFF